jgi:hypothetical protein
MGNLGKAALVVACAVAAACSKPAPTRADPAPSASAPASTEATVVGATPLTLPSARRYAPARVLPPGAHVLLPGVIPSFGSGRVDPVATVVVDDRQAYFSDGAGYVWAQAKDASSPARMLWDGSRGFAMSLVLVGGDVVFGVAPRRRGTDRAKLVRVPKTGATGAGTVITESPDDVISLVSDGTNLYFSLFDGSPIRVAPLAGGASRVARAPGIKNGALAVDEHWLYVADYERGVVVRASKTPGGTETVLARAQPKPVGIAVDASFVYWPCESDGTIRRVPKTGGAVSVVARGQINHDLLAVDAGWVYWASWDQKHTLKRTKKDGSQRAPEVLLTDLRDPEGVAVDSKYVYVANKGAGEVLALPL